MHRWIRIGLSLFFAFLAVNAWQEVGDEGSPTTLSVLQALVGAVAVAAGWGAFRGARWAPAASALYGVVTAGMLIALGPILEMPGDERGGLWVGAGAVLLLALGIAWYLRRSLRPESSGRIGSDGTPGGDPAREERDPAQQ